MLVHIPQTTFHRKIIYNFIFYQAIRRCSVKKVFLEISQNSQKNTCARVSFLIKLQGLRPATLLKKRLWYRCFPVNFVKFIRITFVTENLRWLLLPGPTLHKEITCGMLAYGSGTKFLRKVLYTMLCRLCWNNIA